MIGLLFRLLFLPLNILMFLLAPAWDLFLYLLPVIAIFLIIKFIRGDCDLTLQLYKSWGLKPASLSGKVVWITGASSGIGEALAYELNRAGCKLILSARREEELNRVKEKCLQMPGNFNPDNILVLPFDLVEFESHAAVVKKALEHFKQIDVLVNNGARGQREWIKDTPFEVDRQIVEIVVLAQISLTKALLPHFLEQKSGHVVVTSSLSGKIGTPYTATYDLGKHALHGYFEALRMEHSSDNIAVTMACPGPVTTALGKYSFTSQKTNEQFKGKKMTAERCASLMAAAMANKMGEVWISPHPALLMCYMAQYMPDVMRMFGKRFAKKAVKRTLGLSSAEE